jgi:hypothetical protein
MAAFAGSKKKTNSTYRIIVLNPRQLQGAQFFKEQKIHLFQTKRSPKG